MSPPSNNYQPVSEQEVVEQLTEEVLNELYELLQDDGQENGQNYVLEDIILTDDFLNENELDDISNLIYDWSTN